MKKKVQKYNPTPFSRPAMQRDTSMDRCILLAIIAILLTLWFTGCSDKTEEPPGNISTEALVSFTCPDHLATLRIPGDAFRWGV